MNRKGVTLIELLVVVAIISILAGIAIPSYVGYTKRAARSEAYANLEALRLLQEQYRAEYGEYADKDVNTNGEHTELNSVSLIQAKLKGFKPGSESGLNYDYSIRYFVVSNITNTYIANATGKIGTRMAGDSFWIDQDNNKNF